MTRQSHDKMSAHMGRHTRPFIDMHEQLTTQVHLKFLDYVKSLLEQPVDPSGSQQPSDNPAALRMAAVSTHGGTDRPALHTGTKSKINPDLQTQDGYPLVPEIDIKVNKEDLEDLLRHYVTAQYSGCCAIFY